MAELAAELYNVDWDVILFSETRSAHGRCVLDGGHVLYTSEIATQAAGVAILLHRKHVHRVGQVTSLNERLMFLDLHYGRRCVRFISLYMPHAGYSLEDLRIVYDMLHVVLDEAERLHYKIIVGGDFNTELHVGHRGNFLDEFACMWRLQVANGENHDDSWTFCSSLGMRRKIDFILHGMNVDILKCSISDAFDLGSDHRAVFAQFSIPNQGLARRKDVRKKQTNWKHIDSQTFHSKVESSLNTNMPTTLRDLESVLLCCKNAAEKSRSFAPTLEPWQNPIIQTLIQERRGCRDKTQRAMLSKQIRNHLRANMRQKRNKRLNDILAEFRDLGSIATINDDPVRHQTKLSRAEPSKEDFTTTLSAIFSSDADRVPVVEASPGPSPFSGIEPFSLAEVQEAMFKMRCGRGADGDGLVLELFKYGPPCLHACLVRIYNEILCTGQFDTSWRHTLFTMVPKSGNLQQTKNWRPIAILKITYKIFAKMLHDRLQPLLETEQLMDQVGFRRGTGIDHALAVFETVCGKSIEWNCEIWFASLDLTKAFDRVEHNQLFQALREQHVPQPYIALLRAIYSSQSGAVHGGRPFDIQCGVKQGDILSPLLFNAALECALRKWKGKCEHHGIAMGHHERLTNIRYADDLMLYARSLPALVEMIETLPWELHQIGLQLNAAKSKIFTTKQLDHPMYVQVSQDLVHVLHGGVFPQVSWQTHPWEPETAWLCGITSSQDNRLGKIQQTSDHTYKQTREFEIALEILQCCCHASHAFQFAHVGTDESAARKHQRTTAQNVAINCWLGASEWRGLV